MKSKQTHMLSPLEKVLYRLRMEETKIKMHHSVTAFDKSIIIYFLFLFVGIIGFINNLIDLGSLYLLIIAGMFVLIIGLIPYIKNTIEHTNNLEKMIHSLERRKK